MEKQKNFLQHAIKNNTLLPIEDEMLTHVCASIKNRISKEVSSKQKLDSEIMADTYLLLIDKQPYYLKINLSPEVPNFWRELCVNNFDFHPKIIDYSFDEEFKYFCYEVPIGMLAADISNYPLHPSFDLQKAFSQLLKKTHLTKLKSEDETVSIFNSFLPPETLSIYDTFPVVELFSTLRLLFKQTYKSNPDLLGLCHFDISLDNLILSRKEFKLINFEYAANGNTYLDLLLARENLNVSEESFDSFLRCHGLYRSDYRDYVDASYMFNFAYFNSKIVSEYMTFGVSNPIKLKNWINKSSFYYEKLATKLFVSKTIDKKIRNLYYLWR